MFETIGKKILNKLAYKFHGIEDVEALLETSRTQESIIDRLTEEMTNSNNDIIEKINKTREDYMQKLEQFSTLFKEKEAEVIKLTKDLENVKEDLKNKMLDNIQHVEENKICEKPVKKSEKKKTKETTPK